MSCITEVKQKNYLFFNYIDSYIENTEKVENENTVDANNDFCSTILSDGSLGSIANIVTICKQFVDLYYKHNSLRYYMTTKPSYSSDCEYMNYWLNTKLNNNMTVIAFYTKLRSINTKFDEKGSLYNKLHDINKDELKKLNLLYNLHHKYSNIYKWGTSRKIESKDSCAKISEDFVNDYKVAIDYCFSNETDFCKLLCKLREEYNIVFDIYDRNNECKAQETKLQTYDELKNSARSSSIRIDSNTMSIPLLGPTIGLVFILTFFYRFTAIGSWLRNNVRSIFSRDNNKNTNRNEVLLPNFDNQNIKASQGVYNITYNSARNN